MTGYGNIRGKVFEDRQADGKLLGDPRISGVTVQLIDWNTKEVIQTTQTVDETGEYFFDQVTAGLYKVKFINPDPKVYKFSQREAAGNKNIDSDGPLSDVFRVYEGKTKNHIDTGLYKKASIGDFVWEDLNQDGLQDPNEPGLQGITVKLFDSDGTQIRKTKTNAQGKYQFQNLTPGQYQVEFEEKDGYTFSPAQQGNQFQKDSNGPLSKVITLKSGDRNLSIDAGLYQTPDQLGQVGDYVWKDLNRDGVQNVGEPGVEGVTVQLLSNNGNVLETTTTDSQGAYLFDNLAAGQYQVQFEKPENYKFTTRNSGNDLSDSDANIKTGKSPVFTLDTGDSNLSIDAGLIEQETQNAALKFDKFVRIDEASSSAQHGQEVCDDLGLGKPEALTFQYRDQIDNDYTNLVNGQGEKSSVIGTPDDDGESYIVISDAKSSKGSKSKKSSGKKSKKGSQQASSVFYADTISNGERITAAGDFSSNTLIQIFDDEAAFQRGDSALQTMEYHTSCSVPIALGDEIGSVSLVGYQGKDSDQVLSLPELENNLDVDANFDLNNIGVDADAPSGPQANLGDIATFTHKVSNTGDVDLKLKKLIDNNKTPTVAQDDYAPDAIVVDGFNIGDRNQDGLINAGESWYFQSKEVVTETGLQTNVAKAVARVQGSSKVLRDSDPANYFVLEPSPEPLPTGELCKEEGLGKPEALTFTYLPSSDSNYSDVQTQQSIDKAFAVGTPDDDLTGYVVISDAKSSKGGKGSKGSKSKGSSTSSIFYEDIVQAGDVFTAAGDFSSHTLIQVFESEAEYQAGSAPLQSVNYHTSCSQPMHLNDQLGSVTLVGYNGVGLSENAGLATEVNSL